MFVAVVLPFRFAVPVTTRFWETVAFEDIVALPLTESEDSVPRLVTLGCAAVAKVPVNRVAFILLPTTLPVTVSVPPTVSFPVTARFDSVVLPVTPSVVPTVAAPVTPRDANVAAPEFNVPVIVAFCDTVALPVTPKDASVAAPEFNVPVTVTL
jgi:hypothetical protein